MAVGEFKDGSMMCLIMAQRKRANQAVYIHTYNTFNIQYMYSMYQRQTVVANNSISNNFKLHRREEIRKR